MSDSVVRPRDRKPNPSAGDAMANEAFHRLDLDPPTVEILTAVLTADLDIGDGLGHR
jgi:uncharacterized protein YwlG (UPF0340 family)